MYRTTPPPQRKKKGSLVSIPNITENVPYLCWSSSQSQSSHEGSNSVGNTMVEVKVFFTIHNENENDLQEILSRSSKKGKKNRQSKIIPLLLLNFTNLQ